MRNLLAYLVAALAAAGAFLYTLWRSAAKARDAAKRAAQVERKKYHHREEMQKADHKAEVEGYAKVEEAKEKVRRGDRGHFES
jgi:Flp pilus assembly protein TadB